MGKFSNNWKRRNGNFLGFRSIIDIVCALEILGVVLFLVAPQFVMNYLILNPAAILHGQIWRIVTFLVYPPAITGSDAIMFVLMNALGIYCIRAFGTIEPRALSSSARCLASTICPGVDGHSLSFSSSDCVLKEM